MLTTVSSDKSLVVWKRNENRSQLGVTWAPDGQAFIKPFYSGLFRSVAAKLAEKPSTKHVKVKYASFSDIFSKECDNACDQLKARMKNLLGAAGAKVADERLEKVAVKFRGNAGEILVEKLMREGYFATLFKISKYDPVDPDDERFIDAESLCVEDGESEDDKDFINAELRDGNGMPAGIQIKNYAKHNLIKAKTFAKAAATDRLWMSDRIEPAALQKYVSTQRQFILSIASECKDSRVLKEYGKIVRFIGPKDFDKFELQNGEQRGIQLFEEIADEIDAFKV